MSLYLGLALGLLGVVCVAAGVQNRGTQLSRTLLGGGGGTAAAGKTVPAVAKAATVPGTTFA